MEQDLRRLTTRYSVVSALAGFVTQPIPVVDEIVLLPIHYWFAGSFARKHGRGILRAPWRRLHAIIWGGLGVRAAARWTVGFIPFAGPVASSVTAVAVTQLLARTIDGAASRASR